MEICPLCKGETTDWFPGDPRVLQCRSCEIVFLSKKLQIKNLDDYYGLGNYWQDRLASPENRELLYQNTRQQLRLVVNCLRKPVAGLKLLDVGSHEGVFVEEANHLGFWAIGLEPNKLQVAQARDRGTPLFQGTIENWENSEDFDVITAFHILEHVADPDRVLIKLAHCLKEGGLLVLEVPNIESFLARRHGLGWRFIALEHLFYFSPFTLNSLLDRTGFKIILSEKRNPEIAFLNLNQISHYFVPRAVKRNSFAMKSLPLSGCSHLPPGVALLRKLVGFLKIKKLAALAVKFLDREDHLFIIARKT